MTLEDLLPDQALDQLASVVASVDRAESIERDWARSVTVHFLRNFTIEPLEPYLKFHLLRNDIKPIISYGGYGTMQQETLDSNSALRRDPPTHVVLALQLDELDAESVRPAWSAEQVKNELDDLLTNLLERTSATVIAHTFCYPVLSAEETREERAWLGELDSLNRYVESFARQHPTRVCLAHWRAQLTTMIDRDDYDTRFWHASRAPFRPAQLKRIAENLASTIQANTRAAKKCLVLDCDNTLWGGVIGEDGLEGIELGPPTARGKAHAALQESAIRLQQSGVMLALCSKNNEADVWEVFERHPHCRLTRGHVVASRINWDNKAANIAAIADELNIGLDSFVFVDDSAQECELVRQLLPEVTVIPVPEDPSAYANLLIKGQLFAGQATSAEDRQRTALYQDEARRRSSRSRYSDLSAYLKSLDTWALVRRAASSDVPRVAQLTQKTNQFNLTTKRYTTDAIRRLMESRDSAVYVMSAGDRYGDIGTIGVFIAERAERVASIDTLLLSCRALSRRLEFAFVDACMANLTKDWAPREWRAAYVKTAKNAMVADFWTQVGFREEYDKRDGGTSYLLTGERRPQDYADVVALRTE